MLLFECEFVEQFEHITPRSAFRFDWALGSVLSYAKGEKLCRQG
jgi:hypothetical protein